MKHELFEVGLYDYSDLDNRLNKPVKWTSDDLKLIAEKTYIGMDYQNPGMKLLYSRISGTTVAPLGPDGDVYDFYPLIEFMRKDIRDELPMYTKLFILTSVGVLMNAPNRVIKGKFRA